MYLAMQEIFGIGLQEGGVRLHGRTELAAQKNRLSSWVAERCNTVMAETTNHLPANLSRTRKF
jgi:hypothetical protein